MAGTTGTSTDTVSFFARLREEPWLFDFFHTLRRIEAIYPDRPGFGRSSRPQDDPIRLGQEPDLTFAPATIAAFEPGTNGRPDRLETFFFGVFGPHGPMPIHLTEHALQRKRNEDDPTFARFLDLFHHRMLSFLYRAWADAQPTAQFDRPDNDRFSNYVGALLGIGSAHLRDREILDDKAKLHYVGVLATQTRNAEGLRRMLHDFLLVPTSIEQFVGAWMRLPDADRLRLGLDHRTGMLGRNAVAGQDVWGCQQKFRIVLGPMGIEGLRRLLPGGDSIRRLVVLVRSYAGDEKDWDLQLLILGNEVPVVELGKNGRLGWTSWLAPDGPRAASVGDVILEPMHLAEVI